MKNVLLVDTNFSSGPIYQYLVDAGYAVTVVGGNPQDALAKCVDDYVNIDYSDIKKTRQLIADRKIDYLVPGCNDKSYAVCAAINEEISFFGIDGVEATDTLCNKEKFRIFALHHGLPVPKIFSESQKEYQWPVIIKPTDAYSGRGVTVLKEHERAQLDTALDYARQFSNSQTCIIEEFVEGQLYSHSAFIRDGRILADFIVEEHGTANPFVVDTSRVRYDFPEDRLAAIRENIHLIADSLHLHDGLIHTQLICGDSGYWLIEITRRCPGDLYSQLIEYSTTFNYVENYVRPFVGKDLLSRKTGEPHWIMRHTITQPHRGVLGSISFTTPLAIRKLIPLGLTGDILQASPYGRVGVLFVEARGEQELQTIFEETLQRKLYEISF